MSLAYYNEIDPYAAQWLRNLIDAGHIAPGIVDTRNIEDVEPEFLQEFTQCHFFAGIGVWSLALRRAGWPDDRPVWTGSCPCQPFSAAGKGAGFDDERHLWPAFDYLIQQCRPPVVFGEQVASKDGLDWLDLVRTDLEAKGYAFGAADLCAAGVGAPHIRQRLYWVADSKLPEESRLGRIGGASLRIENATGLAGGGLVDRVEPDPRDAGVFQECAAVVGMADAEQHRSGRETPAADNIGTEANRPADQHGGYRGPLVTRPGPTNGFWCDADWLACRDGKWRAVEPGTFPLANGAAARVGRLRAGVLKTSPRVGRLRAYGNCIVPQLAETFIRAYLETMPDL